MMIEIYKKYSIWSTMKILIIIIDIYVYSYLDSGVDIEITSV
jgi:hypothetical protein